VVEKTVDIAWDIMYNKIPNNSKCDKVIKFTKGECL